MPSLKQLIIDFSFVERSREEERISRGSIRRGRAKGEEDDENESPDEVEFQEDLASKTCSFRCNHYYQTSCTGISCCSSASDSSSAESNATSSFLKWSLARSLLFLLSSSHHPALSSTSSPSSSTASASRSSSSCMTGKRRREESSKESSVILSAPFGSSLLFFMLVLLSFCSRVSSNNISGHLHSSHHANPHHVHTSRKFHEETSFALLEAEGPAFDVREEVQSESISNLNRLRMFEEQATPRNVTAQIGHPVYLHCLVEPIGDKMVSWLRMTSMKDFHLLTVGLFTYTSDDRFVIRHGTLQPNDWALQIKHVTPSDEGIYECQVNSDPPRSQYYHLHIVVPETRMVGSPDMFVRAGSIINLTCTISYAPELPSFVFWYHNERMINYDLENSISGKGSSISLSKNPFKSDSVVSRLVIPAAKLNDSGNYSCHFVGSNNEPAHIYVHVLQGEKRQSDTLQNDGSSSSSGGMTASSSGTFSCYTLLTPSTLILWILLSSFRLFQLPSIYPLVIFSTSEPKEERNPG